MNPPSQDSSTSRWPIVVALAATVFCYWPVGGFEFSSWDDGIHVADNPLFNPPRIQNIGYFWTHPFQRLYIPVTYTVWTFVALAAQMGRPDLSGTELNPYVFHLANLLTHLATCAVAFLVLRRLVRRDWPAAIGALLFALHPLQVEPVAWVSGFRDLLSGLFSLIAIHQYIVAFDEPDSANQRRRLHLSIAMLAFIAAMLAKPTAVSLPLIIVAIDWLVLSRAAPSSLAVSRRLLLLLVAMFFVLAVVIIAKTVQPIQMGVIESPLWSRPLIAGDAIAFYLGKLVAPVNLAMDYGRRPQVVFNGNSIYLTFTLSVIVLGTVWMLRRRAPWLAAGAAIFIAALAPVLGLIPFGFQEFSTVADRYMYLAMLGPSLALAGFLATTTRRTACAIATAVIVVLGMLAHRQVRIWRDDERLYKHTIAINPLSFTANNNLAGALLQNTRPNDAIPFAQRACELKPDLARSWVTLADSLAATNRNAQAVDAYRRALLLQPTHAAGRAKLALALAALGDWEAAKEEYNRAIHDDPDQKRFGPQLQELLNRTPTTSTRGPL